MVQDYLAIPASSTESEQVFSCARLIGTDYHNWLHESNFEALQVLHSAYTSGIVDLEAMLKERCLLSLRK